MKSLKLLLLVLFTTICIQANAQLFVSGNIGFSSTGGSTKIDNGNTTIDKESTTALEFSPAAGYFLTDQFAAGLRLSVGTESTKTPGAVETTQTESTIGFAPFVRYYPLVVNRFSVFGQGSIGIFSTSEKTKGGGTTVEGPKTSTFSVSVLPGVAFDISDNFSLETTINVFRLAFVSQTQKLDEDKDITTSFNFGAGLNDVENTGSIQIGAIYKF